MSGPVRAPGTPSYSSSGTIGFTPEVWSSRLAPKFYAATIFGAIANTDWEGEVKNVGDNVVIRVTPDIAVNDYVIGGGISYQKPTSTLIDLTLDRAVSFGFEVNDIDEYQADVNLMDNFSTDASQQMKIAVDRRVLGYTGTGFAGASDADIAASNRGLTAGAISGNIDLGVSGTPEGVSASTIVSYIINHGTVLDEANVPEEGRWIVLPAWATALIKNSDLKDASLTGDGVSIARNGRVGRIDRFEVFMSNNLPHSATYSKIYAGHPSGLAFASQITKLQNLPNPNDFGTLVRGLNVFGHKVVNSTALTVGYIVAA